MAIGFEDLRVWQEAHRLMLKVYKITTLFPKTEMYSLTDQVKRSALSAPANIAEAHGRHHYLDKAKFLYNARGSADETRSHLMAAKDLTYLDKNEFDIINQEYIDLLKSLNSFIQAIKNRAN
jgi:four helix bundle protein